MKLKKICPNPSEKKLTSVISQVAQERITEAPIYYAIKGFILGNDLLDVLGRTVPRHLGEATNDRDIFEYTHAKSLTNVHYAFYVSSGQIIGGRTLEPDTVLLCLAHFKNDISIYRRHQVTLEKNSQTLLNVGTYE